MTLHIVKLCVGCDTVEELLAWRKRQFEATEPWILRTRQTPRRAEELVDGGSLYRVYKGRILSRQAILAVETVGEGAAARCHMRLGLEVTRTIPTPRRPFQGWRYLEPKDAPPDIREAGEHDVPADLALLLREAGAW